jgi:hypothetical protein
MFAAMMPIVGIGGWKSYIASVRANENENLDDAYV